MRSVQFRSMCFAGVALAGLVPCAVRAQAAPPAQSAPAAPTAQAPVPDDIGSITVTARRVSEKIERVPAAIVAFGAAQLAERSIHTEEDLQTSIPGLTLRQTEGNNSLTFSIRGQTVDAYTGSATAVVPYFNEVPIAVGGASSFYDLESIQVLKGPQGTLFGRNTTGGAVLYSATKAGNDFGGYVQASVGNYNAVGAQGAVNLPIVADKVLLRLAFNIDDRDGYQYDITHNQYLGKMQERSGRATLTINATDNLHNTTVVQYTHSGGNNTSVKLYSAYSCGATNNGYVLNSAAGCLYPGIASYVAKAKALPFWSVETPQNSLHDAWDVFVSNATTYDLASDLKLKNIFGFTRSRALDDVPELSGPYGVILTDNLGLGQFGNIVTTSSVSDELQLQGKTAGGDLTYIAGAYVQKIDTHIFYPQSYFVGVFNSYTTSNFQTRDTTEALFAQGTYDLGRITGVQGLSFTAGLRYSWEKVRLDQLPGGAYPEAASQEVNFSKPSWEGGFSYQATPAFLAYVKTRGSWRGGGLNGVAPPVPVLAAQAGDKYLPETVRDVELGGKFNGRVADLPVGLNVAIYKQWIKNIQRGEFPTYNGASISVTINVPAATVQGLEADGWIKPTNWLTIGASGALTDAKFTDNTATVFGNTFIFGPYSDTPKSSGTVYAKLDIPTPATLGHMSLRGDVYAQTGQYFGTNDATTIPGTFIPGYHLVNLRYDWKDILGSHLSLGAFVRNLTDEKYYVGGLAIGAALGVNSAAVGRPRMFGGELRYAF